MAATGLAPLAIGLLVLVVLADLVFSLGHLDRIGVPESECVDRAGGPTPAVGAMAVAGAYRLARDGNRDSTAEAVPCERLFILAHVPSLRPSQRRPRSRGYSDTGGRARLREQQRGRDWLGPASEGWRGPLRSRPARIAGGVGSRQRVQRLRRPRQLGRGLQRSRRRRRVPARVLLLVGGRELIELRRGPADRARGRTGSPRGRALRLRTSAAHGRIPVVEHAVRDARVVLPDPRVQFVERRKA